MYMRAAGQLDEMRRTRGSQNVSLATKRTTQELEAAAQMRADLCAFIVETLKSMAASAVSTASPDYVSLSFSAVQLLPPAKLAFRDARHAARH